jgi:DNA-binding beta-propeller fold protein YncE
MIDPATQELCVTDVASGTIDVFDAAGNHRYRTDSASRLRVPLDGCIDAEGGFVFTDVVDGVRTIRRLNFLGEPLPYDPERPREEWYPQHLVITADGHYATVDREGLLAKHDSGTGALLWKRQLVDRGSERSDLLGRPAEGPDGTIYVPNAMDGSVLLVGPDGEGRGQFGFKGVKPGELAFPVAVALAPDGEILVLDRLKHKVIAFDAGREFLFEYGAVGFRPGMFYNPVGLAVSRDRRVFVAQGYEGRVQVYRLTGASSE